MNLTQKLIIKALLELKTRFIFIPPLFWVKTPRAFLIALSFLGMNSCKNESSKLQKLEGRWLLKDAEDNDLNVKDRMERIFFDYTKEGTFTTNFSPTGDTSTGAFTVKSDRIILQSPEPITFTIEEWQDSSLEMLTTLRGHEFKLWLRKE